MLEKLVDRQTNILSDLTQKNRGDITSGVEGHRRRPPVGVTELLVGAALSNFDEPQSNKNRYYFPGLEDRDTGHSANKHRLCADELGLQLGLAILQKHADYFPKVCVQLVQRRALAMGAGEPRHVADV